MAKLVVHAGDYDQEATQFTANSFLLHYDGQAIKHDVSYLKELDVASEESVKRIGGTVGWGVAGAAIFGAAGLLAGLLAGGKREEVTFVAKFHDDSKILATTSKRAFTDMQAGLFRQEHPKTKPASVAAQEASTAKETPYWLLAGVGVLGAVVVAQLI